MQELTQAIATDISCRPEGAPITAAAFLHLGNRPAVSRTLRALAKGGVILRAAHGVYVVPVASRFGRHAPHAHLFIHQLAAQSGEAIAPFGAACANALGLTTQVPVKIVYWTSGRTRSYKLGKLTVYLQHVPDWQLVLWDEPPGELVRALAWAGPPRPAKSSARSPRRFPRRRSGNSSNTHPAFLRGFTMPCSRSDSRVCRAAQANGMCPTLRGNGISRREKLNGEVDTIPKPAGLGPERRNRIREQSSNNLGRRFGLFEIIRCSSGSFLAVVDFSSTQRYCCVVPIPGFQPDGLLPPGVHVATWNEIAVRFGVSPYRQGILGGLLDAARLLAKAKCTRLYIDGSFVTGKAFPGDFDACWAASGVDVVLLDPVFLDFSNRRAAQKARFRGELFISSAIADTTGNTFLSFFQIDKNAGGPKGIVALDLGGLP